jgi:hypothetical protein
MEPDHGTRMRLLSFPLTTLSVPDEVTRVCVSTSSSKADWRIDLSLSCLLCTRILTLHGAPTVQHQLEGYLLKQGDKGVIKTWKRRFFMLDGKKLRYYEESKEKGFIDLELAVSIHGVPTQSKEKQAEDSGVDFQEWDLQVVTPTRTYNLRAPKYDHHHYHHHSKRMFSCYYRRQPSQCIVIAP